MDRDLSLLGVLEDTILPGEERTFAPPALEPTLLAAFARQPAATLCLVTVTSHAEVPSLVAGRWGTECEVLAASATELRVRGATRVRVVSGRATGNAPLARVEIATEPADARATLAGAHLVFAALESGAAPEPADWRARLAEPLAGVLRALTPSDRLRDTLRVPTGEALTQLGRSLAAGTSAENAACDLETTLRALTAKPEPSRAQQQRLWSQVVEIQKRLDVYDTTVGTDDGDEVGRLQRRLMQAGLPRAARETARRELRLLRGMPTNHHDYSTHLRYLDLMARLSWVPEPLPAVDLGAVAAALDREHEGLAAAKRRVLEYLAVRALGGTGASTVLCLVGPPGVGKTSIARVIAQALGRKFVRVPLGGVHDESEIRGHRISFTAAGPGRIVAGMARAASATPVVLLDEIDKIGTDSQRNPSAALLEVLDPEQHHAFQDNYLVVPFDLSHALFVCTANDAGAIDPVLRDRLELIDLEGYNVEEKLAIARRHLLPRLREETGLPAAIPFDDVALRTVIESYTREPGVRQLQRTLAAVHRSRALALARAKGSATEDPARPCDDAELRAVLGPRKYTREVLGEALPPGVATGLSVGPAGGAPLFIEVGALRGRGKLRMTGRLGEVMRESAQTALAHLRLAREAYGVSPDWLGQDVHVHVPDAATAKDGPSAGVALFVALLSSATRVPVRADVAFTGEITLNGRVLPVGGVRAKVLAAERAGARCVVLPVDNASDVPSEARVKVIAVRTVREAADVAFGTEPFDATGREEVNHG